MAQFDVHRNQGLQRDTMPFVVPASYTHLDVYKRQDLRTLGMFMTS